MQLAGMDVSLAGFEQVVEQRLRSLEETKFGARLWDRDPTIWKTEARDKELISNSLGWLYSPEKMKTGARALSDFAADLGRAGFRHVLHMGMGGSSLAPLVFHQTFGKNAPGLPVTVLDSTDPATVVRLERSLPLAKTFFIEASKSGTTAESRSFGEYFYERVKSIKGASAGENFAVITDPGSMLEGLAAERSYRKTFLNFSDIGGRYSALSYFGLVPAALMGIDLSELLARSQRMVRACRTMLLTENPGVALGAVMGELALKGRNKLTFLLPAPIASFGMWLEQLIAESTGKDGMGIVPIAGEFAGMPDRYGKDRLFVEFRIVGEPDGAVEARAEALRKAGQPVVVVPMRDRLDLGEQFLLWEVATAAAGAVLGINPFDQPNVQATKSFTNKILEAVRREGRVPEAPMEMAEGPLRLYVAGGATTVPQAFSMFFAEAAETDYAALLAYLTESGETDGSLQRIRTLVRDRTLMATTSDYGPRYLHSTGQLHKGGPNTGLFLLITSDYEDKAVIPGQPYTFGMLMRAQALGDFEALRKNRRRVLRVHITGETAAGLAALEDVIGRVLPARKS
ncbi:MAG: hypothetical protein LLG06_03795 [Desulfobacteraceae bacterium]|nr:hypothetical protein [Desulfobacteraceae bacterium]